MLVKISMVGIMAVLRTKLKVATYHIKFLKIDVAPKMQVNKLDLNMFMYYHY